MGPWENKQGPWENNSKSDIKSGHVTNNNHNNHNKIKYFLYNLLHNVLTNRNSKRRIRLNKEYMGTRLECKNEWGHGKIIIMGK